MGRFHAATERAGDGSLRPGRTSVERVMVDPVDQRAAEETAGPDKYGPEQQCTAEALALLRAFSARVNENQHGTERRPDGCPGAEPAVPPEERTDLLAVAAEI